MNYYFDCSCGHGFVRGADTQEEAVAKAVGEMDQAALDAHFAKYHAGEQKPTLAQAQDHMKNDVKTTVEHFSITNPPVTATA